MIKVQCRTNIDEYKGQDWPKKMACRPLKGDRVVDSTDRYQLYVVGITHAFGPSEFPNTELIGEPYLIVELHHNYPGLGK